MSAAAETSRLHRSDPIPPACSSLESDTGLLCLLIIAQYYDLPAEGSQLRHQFARSGHRLSDTELLRAAKNLGLKAGLVTSHWSKLQETDFPVMAKLVDGGYVVVAKVEGEKALVQNPVEGYSLVLSRDRFEMIWTGELVLAAKRVTTHLHGLAFDMTWIIPGIVKYRRLFGEVVIASAFLQFVAFLTPFVAQMVVDTMLGHREFTTLSLLAGGLIALAVFESILGGLRTYLFAHTANRMMVTLGARFFRHLLSLPLAYFDARRVGDTVGLVRELEHLRRFITSHSMTVLVDLPCMMVFLAGMWFLSRTLTLVVTASLLIYILFFFLMTPAIRARQHGAVTQEAHNRALVVEAISGIQTVKTVAMEPSLFQKWDEHLAGSVRARVHATSLIAIANHIAMGMRHVTLVTVLWIGAARVIDGKLSIGQWIAFSLLSAHVIGTMVRWGSLWQEFQQAGISVERLGDVLNREPEPSYLQNRIAIPQLQGKIQVEDVTFRYRTAGPTVLRKLSFSVEPGQIVGIVGRSGAGKSTIAKLLQCLYRPEQGRILVDGIDMAQIDPAWLRRHVGVVPHESFLFDGSVRSNIALTDPSLSMEQVVQAATLADAHEFIVELSYGYDTLIGERGGTLSSGQRQRIAIARTLAANPRILIFDDATGALDAESEARLQQNMAQMAQGRTVLIIAHRLHAVRQAQRIYVVGDGALTEQGAYEELLEREEALLRPWALQAGSRS